MLGLRNVIGNFLWPWSNGLDDKVTTKNKNIFFYHKYANHKDKNGRMMFWLMDVMVKKAVPSLFLVFNVHDGLKCVLRGHAWEKLPVYGSGYMEFPKMLPLVQEVPTRHE